MTDEWTTKDSRTMFEPGESDCYAYTAVPGHDWSLRNRGWGVGEAKCACGWQSGYVLTSPGGAWVDHLPLYDLGERASKERLWAEVQRLKALLERARQRSTDNGPADPLADLIAEAIWHRPVDEEEAVNAKLVAAAASAVRAWVVEQIDLELHDWQHHTDYAAGARRALDDLQDRLENGAP